MNNTMPITKKKDYLTIAIVGLFIVSLIIFGVVLLKLLNDSQYNTGTSDQTGLSDPFGLPNVDESTIISSSSKSVEFEVEGTVMEVMAEYLLGFSNEGEWIVIEPSLTPEALEYQEVVIQKDDESPVTLSVQTLTDTTVRVTAIQN